MHLLDIRKFGFLFVLLFSAAIIMVSCNDDPDPEPGECDSTNITYDNYAKAFMASNCVASGCHDTAAAGTIGSYETYTDAKAAVDFGRIKGAINHLDGFSNMPKGEEKLADCDIEKLEAWVDAGAPEN